jgi:twitching motility protein PilT
LKKCVELEGSDLHFKSDTGKAYVRVHGDLLPLDSAPFTSDEFERELFKFLQPNQVKRFRKDLELDFGLEIEGVSRFRGNAYQQRNVTQAAFRVIPYDISSMEDLNLPVACYDFIERPRGLVLVTGPAGSGKSTYLAAMISRINQTQPVHIVNLYTTIKWR